jgi:hypothetical protein
MKSKTDTAVHGPVLAIPTLLFALRVLGQPLVAFLVD